MRLSGLDVCFAESLATMSSVLGTDSVFASKESGVTAGGDPAEQDHSGLLQVCVDSQGHSFDFFNYTSCHNYYCSLQKIKLMIFFFIPPSRFLNKVGKNKMQQIVIK